jgi:phosphatidylserine decarboxylase
MRTLFFKKDPLVASALVFLTVSQYGKGRRFMCAALALLSLCAFFRDEDRVYEGSSTDISSPCDGKVIRATSSEIVIFLSPLDMHTQKCVADCEFVDSKYVKGTFNPAFVFEKTDHNEKMTTTFKLGGGDSVEIDQIAGQLARRISNWAHGKMSRGETFGLIKFGSQVRVRVPSDEYVCDVSVNQRVRAGVTRLFYVAHT